MRVLSNRHGICSKAKVVSILRAMMIVIAVFFVGNAVFAFGSTMRKTKLKHYEGNWSVLMVLNQGFYDFYQNWQWHIRSLDLGISVTVVAEDEYAYKSLLSDKSSSVITIKRSDMYSINETVNYDSPLFNKLATRRYHYILDQLVRGNDIVYADTDSVWLHDPLPFLIGDFDLWIQSDEGPDNLCTGFMAFKSNNNTINFISKLKHVLEKQEKTQVDQYVFNSLEPMKYMRVKVLDTEHFPSGKQYFEMFNIWKRWRVTVVHNNYIIGHNEKRERFKKFHLWHL